MRLSELWQYQLPFNAPLSLKYGVIREREGLLFSGENKDGIRYWGEITPFKGLSKETLLDCQDWLISHQADLSNDLSHAPAAVNWGVYLAREHSKNNPQKAPSTLSLNALLTATDPETLFRQIQGLYKQGYRCFKLKLGSANQDLDLARVRTVLETMGPNSRLRLDANQSWSLDSALTFSKACRNLALADVLEYIEEPLAKPELLPELKAQTDWPIALDECLFQEKATAEVWQASTAVILKPMLLGATQSLFWLKQAQISEKKITVSSLFESPWGLGQLAAWAAQIAPNQVAGLDTWRVFTPQNEFPDWKIKQGQLILTPKLLDKPPINTVYLKKIGI
jgi:o-succinylbenzoate synthase